MISGIFAQPFVADRARSEDIIAEIDDTITQLLRLISSLDHAQLNKVPYPGSWTAGQVARHLIKSGSGFMEILNGPAEDTERNPDEKVARIKTSFLNFNTKMDSPEFVLPENSDYRKDELLNGLENIRAGLKRVLMSLDLTKICLAFELPVLGALTRLEAIYFVIYHSQRHIHQLRNIAESVSLNE